MRKVWEGTRSVAEAFTCARNLSELHSMFEEAMMSEKYRGASPATRRRWKQVVTRMELKLSLPTAPVLLGADGKPARRG